MLGGFELKKTKLSVAEYMKDIKKNKLLYIMIIPVLIWYGLFYFKPLYGLTIAFKNFSPFMGITDSPWVGLENFRELLFGKGSIYFWRALKNTIIINFYGIVWFFPIPIILALFFFEMTNKVRRNFYQVILYLPHFISVVVITSIIIKLLSPSSGIVNQILVNLGIIDKPIHFLIEPIYYRTIYILSAIWQNSGYSSIIYFASLMAISPQLYEAAELAGATWFQKVRYISLPGIKGTIMIMFILKIGSLLTLGYEKTLLLYTPQTYEVADILSTYIYRHGIQGAGDISMVTAAELFQALIALTTTFIANKIVKKYSEVSLW